MDPIGSAFTFSSQAIKVFEISKKADVLSGFITPNFNQTTDHLLKCINHQDDHNECVPHFLSEDRLCSWYNIN